MKDRRKIIIYIASGFIIASLLLALYFFVRKPVRISVPVLDEEKKVIVFKDVKYSGEKKGTIDWEIIAKIARKYIDRPVIEMEDLTGKYMPKAGAVVSFKGTKGTMNTEEEKGTVENVDFTYKSGYRLISRYMDFDFKKGLTYTTAPVDIQGTKLNLKGVGLTASTEEGTVKIERDVIGYIETDKGRYRFESDRFTYNMKDNVYILESKVIMKGQDINLLCDRLYLINKDNEMERIDARGKVRLISKGTIAKSEKAVYHFKEDRVVLTERPKIIRNNVEMEGESIVYNLANGKFSINKPKMRMEK
jgi:lipopolysaccharide transport protein LptA/LPS export ABC transporter protein LptC